MSGGVHQTSGSANVVLDARNLVKSFGGVHATQNVSIRVVDREIFGLIGPNGSGKTTLLNLLAGFYQPDAGSIVFRGQPIAGRSANEIARLGLVRSWQDPRTIGSLTVWENVELGSIASGRTGPAQKARIAGLLEKFELTSVSDRRAAELPYGKQKIVALARTFAVRPTLLMLDEPLAGLSIPEQQQMVGYIREFQRVGSVIIVDHAFSVMAKLCDRLAVLNSGQKLAEGTPAEISADRRVAEVYLG